MATTSSMDLVALVREHLAEAHPDVLRSLIETFVEALMGAEVDAICCAAYHQPRAHTSAHTASQPSFARRGLAPPERKDPKASGHVHGRGVLSRAVSGPWGVLAQRRPPRDPGRHRTRNDGDGAS